MGEQSEASNGAAEQGFEKMMQQKQQQSMGC